MRKGLLIAHALLMIYAIIHIVTNFMDGGVLQSLLINEADPYLLMVFNLLGLFPLAFILFGLKYLKMAKPDWIFLSLGFMLGGFMLTIPFIKGTLKPKTISKRVQITALIGLIITVLVIGYGIILGDLNVYIDAFKSDSFVHIMTIDFIFLYGLSIYLSYKSMRLPWISLIPVVGFYYLLFQDSTTLE